jgi:hypothetical protein
MNSRAFHHEEFPTRLRATEAMVAPVTAAQSRTRRRMPQGDAELMQVLGFKPAPRLEQGDDEHSE